MAFIPVGQRPLAYLDVETSGLQADKHEILSIAIVFDLADAQKMDAAGLTFPEGADFAYFSTLVQPQQIEVAEPKALEVNGYAAHPEKWLGAPSFNEISTLVAKLLDGAVLCGHNVSFDAAFIQDALRRTGNKTRIDYHKVDTITTAYTALVPCGLEKLSLDSIRDFLGWDKEGAHTALQDALDARQLYKVTARSTWLQRWWWSLSFRRRSTPAGKP